MGLCGVCSISFRGHTAEEIIAAVKAAGLDGIEWGSDVHVRPDDPDNAWRVRRMMDAAGLVTLSYGTYFGIQELSMDGLAEHIHTADILGTDVLRIWPPRGRRSQIPEEDYEKFVAFARRAAAIAKAGGKTLCLERHPHMLTESAEEALEFLRDVGADNLQMYWQPDQFVEDAVNLASARRLADTVQRLHVFYWRGETRYPLEEGVALWREYAKAFRDRPDAAWLLEFMHDDRLSSLSASAAALREILSPAAIHY